MPQVLFHSLSHFYDLNNMINAPTSNDVVFPMDIAHLGTRQVNCITYVLRNDTINATVFLNVAFKKVQNFVV